LPTFLRWISDKLTPVVVGGEKRKKGQRKVGKRGEEQRVVGEMGEWKRAGGSGGGGGEGKVLASSEGDVSELR